MTEAIHPDTIQKLSGKAPKYAEHLILNNGILEPNADHHTYRMARDIIWRLSPVQGAVPNNFTEQPIRFRINRGFYGECHSCALEITVTEYGGTTGATPLIAPYLLDRVEIAVNGDVSQV
jgi:hypothetical protein